MMFISCEKLILLVVDFIKPRSCLCIFTVTEDTMTDVYLIMLFTVAMITLNAIIYNVCVAILGTGDSNMNVPG